MFTCNLLSWTKFALVASVITSATFVASSASACDPPCKLKPVVNYVQKSVPYEACVIKYDHCGRPYETYVTKYRIDVVKVISWVKVCEI